MRRWSVYPSVLRAAIGSVAVLLSAACSTPQGGAVAGGALRQYSAAPVDISPVAAADPGSALPEGWQHGAFIEIFVRGYKDSDGDGIGDLRGLTQQLDYLQDLGIKGIWLMPITASDDHDHGYATTDYRSIEPAYGTLADFDELVRQAHARGIGIIIDYVVNHSAATHPLFVDAASSPQARFRNWFMWQNTAPAGWDIWGKNPWTMTPNGAYFATFGPHMPDFNLRNRDVVAYHKDSLRFWLNRGLDGFRLDAVPHLIENNARDWNDQPESRALTNELRALVHGYARRHVVCEATAEPKVYAAPDVCSSAFAFGLERNVIDAARGKPAAIRAVAEYFTQAPHSMATMVSNHDIFAGARLYDQVGGDIAQYKLAAATYLLLPGTPFIYYGEEVGMAGVKGLDGDPSLRAPMSWTADASNAGFTSGTPFRPVAPNTDTHNAAAAAKDPDSILSFYKTMLRLRNTLPSIARGSYEAPFVHGSAMGYQRKLGDEHSFVLINYGPMVAFLNAANLPANAALVPAYPQGSGHIATSAEGRARIAVKPHSVMVFTVKK